MNFLDTLRAHGIIFRRSNTDLNEITICCPFCEFRSQTEDRRFRLGLNIKTKQGHCFNCEWKSREALKEVSEALNFSYESDEVVEEKTTEISRPDKPALPEDFIHLSQRPRGVLYLKATRYIYDRGIKDWQIEEKKIGVSLIGKYAYRIIFPVYYKKELQGLVARDFTGQQELPYLNTEGMKSLYNRPNKSHKKAVLCEGVFDCLAIEQILPRLDYDVMAVLGRSLTQLQQEQLKDYRDIILWPDADTAGVKGFLDVADVLKREHRVFMTCPFGYGKDAGGMDVSDRKYVWATRTKYNEMLDMRMRAEIAFKE